VSVHHGRMVRAFSADPVEPAALDRVLDAGRRAPAAGNTAEGRAFVVLDETGRYWDVALPAGPRRAEFAWPGLLVAPVLVLVCVRPEAWSERYAEADKDRAATLGRGPDAWPQPFWWFDAGTATEAMLLQARAEGLGACVFGLFEREVAVLGALDVPAGWRGAAVLALGHADEAADERRGRSASRARPPLHGVVHRNHW
jgi:nitroreductase